MRVSAGASEPGQQCLCGSVNPRMNKKRKASSPGQGQSDMCADLKQFIAKENAKSVKEIKESNEKRMAAIEESLTFAMDALSAVSERQKSAEQDIGELKKLTADLKQRLQQMELHEDRQQQERRLACLIFSGAVLQAHTHRDDALEQIRAVLRQFLNRDLDRSQVRNVTRLRNGKVIIEFTTAEVGSNRDDLFRAKAKLRGSGLFVTESLTPRRQAMFAELLQMKKDRKIHSVFTRSGTILVCRSRDSPPLRVADPEAVRQLSGSDAPRRPAQRRVQVEDGRGPSGTAAVGRAERGADGRGASSDRGSGDVSTGRASLSDPSSRSRTGDVPLRAAQSPLLSCARETVQLVQLAAPLEESSIDAASTPDEVRRPVSQPSRSASLGTPLLRSAAAALSPPRPAPASGECQVASRDPQLPPAGNREELREGQTAVGGAVGVSRGRGPSDAELGAGEVGPVAREKETAAEGRVTTPREMEVTGGGREKTVDVRGNGTSASSEATCERRQPPSSERGADRLGASPGTRRAGGKQHDIREFFS